MSAAFDDLMGEDQPLPPSNQGAWLKERKGQIRSYQKVELDFSNIRAVMSEPRCKICAHPDRAEIDKAIYRQRMKDVNDDGEPFTFAYLVTVLTEMGVPTVNKDNIQGHWRKHVEVPSLAEKKAEKEALDQILEKLTSDQILTMPRAELLDLMMRQGVLEAGSRLRSTGKSGITIDQVLKIAELQIREKGSEAQNEFLKALGGGIVASVRQGISQTRAKQLAEAEVIVDADAVEEVAA